MPRMASSTPPRPQATRACSRSRFWPTAMAFRDADPVRALDALRRGLVIAQDSGNRSNESHLAVGLADSRPNTATRWPRSITSLWRSATYHDAGNTTAIRVPLAILAALFDRLGRYEPAATIAGFALSPLTATSVPRNHHRDHPPARCPR